MGQRFIDFGRASNCNYCRNYCAKCYFQFVRDFIEPLEKANGTLPEGGFPNGMSWDCILEFSGVKTRLAEELKNLPLSEFIQIQNWRGQICIAFAMLKDNDSQTKILRHWLGTCPEDVRFVDVVVFYLLPHSFVAPEINEQWVAKAVGMAVTSRDYSLVESLVWRLRGGLDKYPDLLRLATELQKTSRSIAKAMNARFQAHG